MIELRGTHKAEYNVERTSWSIVQKELGHGDNYREALYKIYVKQKYAKIEITFEETITLLLASIAKEYTEREVNSIIADFRDAFCTLRRKMIGEDILTRENSIYKLVND